MPTYRRIPQGRRVCLMVARKRLGDIDFGHGAMVPMGFTLHTALWCQDHL